MPNQQFSSTGATAGRSDPVGEHVERYVAAAATWDDASEKDAEVALAAVRERADKWRAGTTSLLGLILASLALGTSSGWAMRFEGGELYALAGLAFFTIIVSTIGLVLVLRAAYGPWTLQTLKQSDADRAKRLRARGKAAERELRLGQSSVLAATFLFAVAVLGTWLLNPASNDLFR